jgi:hypothetical protein
VDRRWTTPSKAGKERKQVAHSMRATAIPADVHNAGTTALGLRGVWMEMYESNQLPKNHNNKSL